MTVQCQTLSTRSKDATPDLGLLGLRPFQRSHNAIKIGSFKHQLLSQKYNIVLQRRHMSTSVKESLQLVEHLSPFRRRVSFNMHGDEHGLSDLILGALDSSETEQWLLQDMQDIALDFCGLLGHGHLFATLALIDRTMCPRWHADHVTMRCLCTYFGAGTKFVENRYADRRQLQRLLFQDTEGYGIRDERAVQTASAGDVLYLKGHAFPGNAGCGAVHRSPAASTEAPRLVFTLDEAIALPARDCSCGKMH